MKGIVNLLSEIHTFKNNSNWRVNMRTSKTKSKGKKHSIRRRLITYFAGLMLLTSAIIGVLAIISAGSFITKEAEQALISLASQGAALTMSRVETQLETLKMISLNEDIASMDWQIQQPILQRQLDKTDFLDIGVVDRNGNVRYSTGETSQLGDRDYIKKALGGQANVSDLIVSRVTNQVVLMYAAPIEKDGKVVGALIGRRDGNSLSEIVDSIDYGESGYAYMINNDGTVVAHPDKEKVMNQFNPIR